MWQSLGTVKDVVESMKLKLINAKYDSAEKLIIFDRYEGISTKDHERQRRGRDGSIEF